MKAIWQQFTSGYDGLRQTTGVCHGRPRQRKKMPPERVPPGLKPISRQRADEIAMEYLRKVVPPDVWNAISGEHQQGGGPEPEQKTGADGK